MMIVTIVAMSRTSRQHPAPAPTRKPSPTQGTITMASATLTPIPPDHGLEEETPRRRGGDEEFGDDDPIPADYGLND